ncbi:MAG: SDR family oxidoreductase [Chloroflexi bacterium]|nr:SDR family oxidoreductase [Chloroflexota bacterium]
MTDLGAKAAFFVADLASRNDANAAVAAALEMYGRIDCLATCHAYDAVGNLFLDDLEEEWDRMIAVNFKGTMYVCRAVLPAMIRQGGGRIVNITSDSVKIGLGRGAVNAATKGAVAVFSKSLARELARDNIRVNCVCPGPTETPALRRKLEGPDGQRILKGVTEGVLLRRLAQPEEIGAVVAFLSSDEAGFVTGQLISVSGGLSMY